MEGLALTVLKLILFTWGLLGIIFHLLAFKNPESASKMEQSLEAEFGFKKRIVPWLEKNRMRLNEWLMESRAYNICAIIFLILVLILLFQIR